MSRRLLNVLALLSLLAWSGGQYVVRRDEGDIVYTQDASWNYCGRIGGYCAVVNGQCDYCICNFRRTYTSNTGRCEEYYTGKSGSGAFAAFFLAALGNHTNVTSPLCVADDSRVFGNNSGHLVCMCDKTLMSYVAGPITELYCSSV